MPVACISKDGRVDEAIKLLHQPDFPPEAIALLEKVAASLPGMIFQFRQKPDGSRLISYVSSGCLAVCELQPEVFA